MIRNILEELGYKPVTDNDGDLIIRYQMKSIVFITREEFKNYVVVMLPQFAEVEDGEETIVLATCNKLTREMKMVKVFIDNTLQNVSATCEFFFADENGLKDNITKSLELLGVIRSSYIKSKSELTE